MSYDSPFAVCLPWKYRPYQEAVPIWSQRRTLLDCTGVAFTSGALAGVGEPASLADAVTPSATSRVAMAAPRREGICLSPIIVEKIFTATSSLYCPEVNSLSQLAAESYEKGKLASAR
jgi:hypothetical protein